jgi:predicted ATPase
MRLITLGGAALEGTAFRRPKALLLLAYLAVEGPRERRHLRTLFWPKSVDPALSLRALLFELKSISPHLVESDGTRLQLGIPADVTELLTAFSDDPESIPARYTGAFLEGLSETDLGVELEEWVYVVREFLARQVRLILLRDADRIAAAGDARAAAVWVQQAWRLPGAPPVDVHELQRMYVLCAAAGHSLSTTLQRVARELGVDLPEPPEAAPVQVPSHQKTRPVLPAGATAFIGREMKLRDLQALLRDPEVRLLTLLGPGGIGKTCLAQEIARTHQTSQVVYVPLDAVVHAEEVPSRIATALGVDLSGGQAPLETVVTSLGSQTLLLILDNYEQRLSAQPLVALLESCSGLSILVTSREPLELEWELVYPLAGLDLAEHEGNPHSLRSAEGRHRFDVHQLTLESALRRLVDGPVTPVLAQVLKEACSFWIADGRAAVARDLLERARRQGPLGRGLQLTAVLARVHQELGEHDAAEYLLRHALHAARPGVARSRAQLTLARVLHRRSAYQDAVELCSIVLASSALMPAIRCQALYQRGRARLYLGQLLEAETDAAAALEIAFPEGRAWALNTLALIRVQQGQLPEAQVMLTEALALHEARSEHAEAALNLTGLAWTMMLSGDAHGAAQANERLLRRFQKSGSLWELTNTLINLGHARARLGDWSGARVVLLDAVQRTVQLDAPSLQAEVIGGFADLAFREGNVPLASRLFFAACDHPGNTAEFRHFFAHLGTLSPSDAALTWTAALEELLGEAARASASR